MKTIIKWKSTSKDSFEIEPIILKENNKYTYEFYPLIVNNQNDNTKPLKWKIIVKRKDWNGEFFPGVKRMKKYDCWELRFDTDMIDKLIHSSHYFKSIYEKYWIQFWEKEFIVVDWKIKQIIEVIEDIEDKWKTEILIKLLEKLDKLEDLSLEDLDKIKKIKNLVDISELQFLIAEIKDGIDKKYSEKYWHNLFLKYKSILSQIFYHPVEFVGDELITDFWNRISNGKWEKKVDFWYDSTISPILVEIKTSNTPLITNPKRWDKNEWTAFAYSVSYELSSAINQLLVYMQKFKINVSNDKNLNNNYNFERDLKWLLIIGNSSLLTEQKLTEFNLFRAQFKDIEIVTYDELLSRIISYYNFILNPNLDDINQWK